MRICVDKEIVDLFPNLAIGVVVAQEVDNASYPDALSGLLVSRASAVRDRFRDSSLNEDARIVSWRDAYRKMGVNPKKHVPTAEAYVGRALKDRPLPKISAAVDSYLASELQYLLPTGGYDLDTLRGDITLTAAAGGETFEPLGGGPSEVIEKGEIVYKDDCRVLTRRWNYRDADPTKITSLTKRLVLCTESVDATFGVDYLGQNIDDIARLLREFCRAKAVTMVLRAAASREIVCVQ